MRLVHTLALIALACGTACHNASPSNNDHTPPGRHEQLATLERTACFGTCPVYKIAIFGDGAVEYEGERFVKTQGHATGHIGAEQLAQLRKLFQDNGYLQLENSYEKQDVTDLPSVFTSYTPGQGQTKSIRHYLGDRSAPKALTEVEEGIDRIVHVEQWIGTEEERRNLPRT
jgi:uncharacterized protein DUF6438